MTLPFRARVRLTEDYGSVQAGQRGVVRGNSHAPGFVAVEFPEAFEGGIDCRMPNGVKLAKYGHGAWLPARLLEMVEGGK